MDINSVKLIYFSPTRTTRKIVEGLAHGAHAVMAEHVDLTPPYAELPVSLSMRGALAVIGSPVYSGRIPVEMISRLGRIDGEGAPAAVVVTYGNRAYEDALLELRDIASERGFKPVAAGAFIGEHSFSNTNTPIAVGRPDPADILQAKEFGKKVRRKLSSAQTLDALLSFPLPGNFPYRERPAPSGLSPATQEELCTRCGQCASVCPIGCISVDDTVTTKTQSCIRCCACVKGCLSGARTMDAPHIMQIAQWLSTNCGVRKEPEFFI